MASALKLIYFNKEEGSVPSADFSVNLPPVTNEKDDVHGRYA
jgi:hypothetical protein